MKVRSKMALGAAVTSQRSFAVSVLRRRGSAARQAGGSSGRARHATRQPQRQGLQHPCSQGLAKAEKDLGVKTRVFSPHVRADHMPNLQAAAQAGADLVIATASCCRGPSIRSPTAVPEHEVRDHRLPRDVDAVRQARERRAGCLSRRRRPAASSATSPRVAKKKGGKQVIGAVGGEQDPAGRH